MEGLLISIIVPIAIPIVFSIFFAKGKKEENKFKYDRVYVVRTSKAIKNFFVGWMIVCLMSSLVIPILCITDPEKTTIGAVIGISSVIILFFGLGLFGYLYTKFNYSVVKESSIIIKKWNKEKCVSFDDIKYVSSLELYSNIAAYDKDFNCLFAYDQTFICIDRLISDLKKINAIEIKGNINDYKKNIK